MNYGKYFNKNEFDCKCGCGLNNISQNLVDKLNTLRELLKDKVIINSACRCLKHNKKIGGSDDSEHLRGLAVDIKAENSNYRFNLLKVAFFIGFNRIGVDDDFVHLDISENKSQKVLFLY